MAGGSYGRSVSLSGSLTNALLIRSLAPRAMRPSGPILVVRALVPTSTRSPAHWPRLCRLTNRDLLPAGEIAPIPPNLTPPFPTDDTAASTAKLWVLGSFGCHGRDGRVIVG